MPLTFAAIAPHGFPIIPDLSDDAEGALKTRESMNDLGERFKKSGAEVIVIATPHGVRAEGMICIANVARSAGTLHWKDRTVELNVPVDADLTDGIAAEARARNVPIALAGFAGNKRFQSSIPMDWGVLTPLWFLAYPTNMIGKGDVLADIPEVDEGPPSVIINPARELPREAMVEFGRAVADAATKDPRKIAFIASCDWGHCHKEYGPYGFHPASAEVDAKVVKAIEDQDLHGLINLPEEDVQNAAIDGLWQTLILAGVLESVPMTGEMMCYEAPSYYGMIVAAYEPQA